MKRIFVLAIAALIAFGGVLGSARAQEMTKTIADIVVETAGGANPEFTTLLAAVQAADPAVLETLSNKDAQLTVFAPTDAAFKAVEEALGAEAWAALLADPARLTSILTFHVVPAAVKSTDVVAMLEEMEGAFSVQSAQGQYIDVASSENGITINGANLNLEMVDIEAVNGVIHVIDAVILPETKTIAELVQEAATDTENPQFTTLLAAVAAADEAVLTTLADTNAKLTVFAPTDEAFSKVPAETLTALLADKAGLTNVLLYHVIPTVAGSDAVTALLGENTEVKVGTALTRDGAAVEATIKVMDGKLMIDGANIVATNIDAANGIIHVIDAVILPPQ
ncbi:MAG: hypothetical protein OHK0023_17580 [Anaerolineae bacterium]